MYPTHNQQQASNDLFLQQQLFHILTQVQQNASARMQAPNPIASLFSQSFLPQNQQPPQPRVSLPQQVGIPQMNPSQLPLSMSANLTLPQSILGQNRVEVDTMRRRPSLITGGASSYGGFLESGNGSSLSIDTSRPTLNTNVEVRHSPMQPLIIDEELERQRKEINDRIEKVDKEKRQAECSSTNLAKRMEYARKIIAEKSESTIEDAEESEDELQETSFIDRIYAENKRRVANNHNANPLLKNIKSHNPLPLYQEPSDLKELREIRQNYMKIAPFLIKQLREKRENNRILIEDEHRKYKELCDTWQKKVEKWEKNPKKLVKDAKSREIYEKLFPEIKKSREEKERSIRSDRSRISMGGNLSLEKEEQREEDKFRNAAVIPPIACVGPPIHSFNNSNGLVPEAFTDHKNRLERFVNSWKDEEKKTFEDNISNYGKNFAAIALFLKSKSVKDCVWYYYMSKKKTNYKAKFTRRKKKIGKQYKPPTMPQLGDILPEALQQTSASKSSRVLVCLLCDAKIETYILPPQLTRSACDMYGYDVNDPNSVNEIPICHKCATAAVKHKAANRCPIGTCPPGKRKAKPVRTLPEKLNSLTKEQKRFIVHRLKVPPSASKCCNNCFKRISKDIEHLTDGKLDAEVAEFVRQIAEKTALLEDSVDWAENEIHLLKLAVACHGTTNWEIVAKKIGSVRILAQHCQRQFEKMSTDGNWPMDLVADIKENTESDAETLSMNQIKEIKVEIPEVASPELGTSTNWTSDEKKVEHMKIEDKEDDIVILTEVRYDDQATKKEVPLLTVFNETQEQESSSTKSFGSITQGTPLLRSSNMLPPHLTSNPLKSSLLPFEQPSIHDTTLPGNESNQLVEYLRILMGLPPNQSVQSAEMMQYLEIIARQFLHTNFGVEPTREMVETVKSKLAASLYHPQQQQQQQQQQQFQLASMLNASLLNMSNAATIRKEQPPPPPPTTTSFFNTTAVDQIKMDIATAQMMADERKVNNEALMKYQIEKEKQKMACNLNPRLNLSTFSDSVIIKTSPDKPEMGQMKNVKRDAPLVEAHRSAFSAPTSAQTLRMSQPGASLSSMYQTTPTQQNLGKHVPMAQAVPATRIEDKRAQPTSVRVEHKETKHENTSTLTRKSGLATALLPSPVAPVPTSTSIRSSVYTPKRAMSPALSTIRNTSPSIQQRNRTTIDTAGDASLVIPISQTQPRPSTFSIAQRLLTTSSQQSVPKPPTTYAQPQTQPQATIIQHSTIAQQSPTMSDIIKLQIPATVVPTVLLPEPSAVVVSSPTVVSTQTSVDLNISSTTPSYSILGPWADSVPSSSRTTFVSNIPLSNAKEETTRKIETFLPILTSPVFDNKKEPQAEIQTIQAPCAITSPVVTKPICSTAYEALSDSDSEDADKHSIFSQSLADDSNEPPSSSIIISLLALPTEDVITLSDSISTPPIRTPESTRSESVKITPQSSSSAPYVQPTYEPLSDDED